MTFTTFRLKVTSDEEMKSQETKLKKLGYKKKSDSEWAKIYTRPAAEVIITKEY